MLFQLSSTVPVTLACFAKGNTPDVLSAVPVASHEPPRSRRRWGAHTATHKVLQLFLSAITHKVS